MSIQQPQNGTRFLKRLSLAVVLIALFSQSPLRAQQRLINLQQRVLRDPNGAEVNNMPAYIKSRLSYIETLPFDGLGIHTFAGIDLMDGALHDFATIANEWAPLKGVTYTRIKYNFAIVNVKKPADLFDDWSNTLQSFRNFARAIKEAGITGILFDNEEYTSNTLWLYPQTARYTSKTLQEYSDQARQRGRDVMNAIQQEYPNVQFMVLLSPADSFTRTPDIVNLWNGRANFLAGPFTVGCMEVSNLPVIDGNEVSYNYRTQQEFNEAYTWRKTTMATDQQNCPFIPSSLRPIWPTRISISEAAYNHPINYANGLHRDMNPTIMRSVLEMAIRGSEQYAWLYWEGGNWYLPKDSSNGVSSTWYNAISGAWDATRTGAKPNPPENLRVVP